MSLSEVTYAKHRTATQRQLQLVEFMAMFHKNYGRWPTQRAMANGLGIRSTNMGPYIALLVAHGLAVRIADPAHRGGNVALTQAAMQLLRQVRPRSGCSVREQTLPPPGQHRDANLN